MKKAILLVFVLSAALMLTSCYQDRDDVIHLASDLHVKDFVYRGMKQFYLYKSEDAVLDNGHFANVNELNNFLGSFPSPEAFFNSLLSDQDRFSVIFSNFHKLENLLNGISLNNGMAFGLVRISGTSQVFGYVRYVLPNTSAESQGVVRGMLFDRIDGTPLRIDNYSDLLKPEIYTIGLATLDGQGLHSLNQSITLTKTQYSEDPVFIHKVIEEQGHKIGYLMYNGFISSFDSELNAAFGDFQAQGITDLVVDLRYNPGGSIETSKDLASMITGQFNGQLFATEIFNSNFENQELLFDNTISTGAAINSLHLNKVYIITTGSTASASELLINGLNAYIDVVQVGKRTVGKFQGSITIYDSSDFRRESVLPGHTYAMQPLILKTANADGYTDFVNGLAPDIEQGEDFANLGTLGDAQEPLLNTAIQNIIGGTAPLARPSIPYDFEQIGENKMDSPIFRRMYVDMDHVLKQ